MKAIIHTLKGDSKPGKIFWALVLTSTFLTCLGLISPLPLPIFVGAFSFTFVFSMLGHRIQLIENGKYGGYVLGMFSLGCHFAYFSMYLLGVIKHPAGLVGTQLYLLFGFQIAGWLTAFLIGQRIWK